jgi:L-rhamnose mutarotase
MLEIFIMSQHHPKIDTQEEYDELFDKIWQEVESETQSANVLAQLGSLSLEDFEEDENESTVESQELIDILSKEE